MALTPNFTASVDLATATILYLEDSSTGSDGAITQRRVRLQLANGTYLLTGGQTTTNTTTGIFPWNYSVSFLDLNVLNRDYALAITVEWLNVSNTVIYTKLLEFDFTCNSSFGNLALIKNLAANPSLVLDQNWFYNKIQLTVAIDDANNAITFGSDVASSQAALDRASYLLSNQLYFF